MLRSLEIRDVLISGGDPLMLRDANLTALVRQPVEQHAKGVADGVELRLRPLADRVDARLRMALIDGNELGSEAETDDGNVDFRHDWLVFRVGRKVVGETQGRARRIRPGSA